MIVTTENISSSYDGKNNYDHVKGYENPFDTPPAN